MNTPQERIMSAFAYRYMQKILGRGKTLTILEYLCMGHKAADIALYTNSSENYVRVVKSKYKQEIACAATQSQFEVDQLNAEVAEGNYNG